MENISILGKQGWKIYLFQENRDGKYIYSRRNLINLSTCTTTMTRGLQGNMFIMTVKESGFIRHIFLYSLNPQQGQYHSSFFYEHFQTRSMKQKGDITCFADGYFIFIKIFKIGYCICGNCTSDKYFLHKQSTRL